MSLNIIRKILEQRLDLLPALSTARMNVNFIPTTGIAHQRLALITAEPDNPTLGGGNYYREQGIFQVTLCYPQNTAIDAINARAELTRAQFNRGLGLTDSGITVMIAKTAKYGAPFHNAGWFCIPVIIEWYSHIN